jgi:hypothetical protein
MKKTLTLVLVLSIIPFAVSSDVIQQIVPDEITVRNRSVDNEGSNRVSNADLIKSHNFKLSKGGWSLSYKPGGTVPFVWCALRHAGEETNSANRTYKIFKGYYKDTFNNLTIKLGVFENGTATVFVTNHEKNTEVYYFLDDDYSSKPFWQAIYNNN